MFSTAFYFDVSLSRTLTWEWLFILFEKASFLLYIV